MGGRWVEGSPYGVVCSVCCVVLLSLFVFVCVLYISSLPEGGLREGSKLGFWFIV